MLKHYPGSKAGAGVFQTIINEMPPHELYIEAFVGGGSILLRKKPAEASIVIDADAEVAGAWSTIAKSSGGALTAIHGDCRSILARRGGELSSTLIYCDPPYVRSTRRMAAPLYNHEFSDEDHRSLLSLLLTLKASVMISGYRSALYDGMLAGWRRIEFPAMTHRGPSVEPLWMNFNAVERHDYTYIGKNFRERERIKRKKTRWLKRLAAMPELERFAMLEAIETARASLRPASAAGGILSPEVAVPDLDGRT